MDGSAAPTPRRWSAVGGVVFGVAVLARVFAGLHGRGFSGSYSYDAGVYYTAADALTYGHLPYRDFVLLHPSGLPLALTPFALLGRAIGDSLAFTTAGLATSVVGGVNAVLVPVVSLRGGQALPGRRLGRAVAAQRCVVSDLPTALIRMNVLSRDYNNHCRVWVDITGLTYGRDRGARQPDGHRLPRPRNPVWQRDVLNYLESANAIVLARTGRGPGESQATLGRIEQKPVLARVGRYPVYLNVPRAAPTARTSRPDEPVAPSGPGSPM